jgi:hypothetical protein
MSINDQLLASTSLVREGDRAQPADTRRESYQKHPLPLTDDEVRQSPKSHYGFCARVINISRRAVSKPALMLRITALSITWFVLLVMTIYGIIWAEALRQIQAIP